MRTDWGVRRPFCSASSIMVLDGTGGIEVFQLGQKAGLEVILFFKMGELQQGGVADELGGGSVDICHRNAS